MRLLATALAALLASAPAPGKRQHQQPLPPAAAGPRSGRSPPPRRGVREGSGQRPGWGSRQEPGTARHGGRLGTEGKDGTRRPRPLLPHRRGSSARSRGFRAKPPACTPAAGNAFSTVSFVRRDGVPTTTNKVEAKGNRTPRSRVIKNNLLFKCYASKI